MPAAGANTLLGGNGTWLHMLGERLPALDDRAFLQCAGDQ